MRSKIFFLTLVAASLVSFTAQAATVTLDLILEPLAGGCVGCTLSGPGTFQVTAMASLGDNGGIAGYGIPISNFLTLRHLSPRTNLTTDPGGEDPAPAPAGFTLLRSANNTSPLGAGQDTITPTDYLIYGLGQEVSSFSNEYPGTSAFPASTQTSWGFPLVLAEGTYNPSGPAPAIDFLLAAVNTFLQAGNSTALPATVVPGGADPVIPEPSSIALAGLALVGLFGLRRRS